MVVKASKELKIVKVEWEQIPEDSKNQSADVIGLNRKVKIQSMFMFLDDGGVYFEMRQLWTMPMGKNYPRERFMVKGTIKKPDWDKLYEQMGEMMKITG